MDESHSYFYVDVTGKDGKVANWKFEGFPPNVLYRTGWKRDVTIKPGDTVTVFGWRARAGAIRALGGADEVSAGPTHR